VAAQANRGVGRVDQCGRGRGGWFARGRSKIAGTLAGYPAIERFSREHICHLGAAAFAILLVAPISLLFTDRRPPFKIISGEITPALVLPGGHVSVRWHTTPAIKDCTGEVYRVVRDSKGVVHSYEPVPVVHRHMRESDEIIAREFALPNGISWGVATYEAIPYFTCNWTQRFWPIRGENPILKFEVMPAPLPIQLPQIIVPR
jgi:hypothetical protein